MHYANSIGLDKVVAKMREYQEKTGSDFWEPCKLMVDLAAEGKRF